MSAKKIGKYVIDGVLGSGAAGTAYRAHHEDTGEKVAVKLLSDEMSKDPTMQRRFAREMEVLHKLAHPNIVKFYEGGTHGNHLFYAMELVRFGTLKEVLEKRSRLTWREAVECTDQVCAALQRAHENGIVHRDLKPPNLFLSDDGLLKLGDFGLARDLSGPALTQEGMTVGTCLYMAPEQIQGLTITPATDIYALGCLLFEMIAGRVPFRGTNAVEILDQHFQAAPPDVRAVVPQVPAELATLIQRMMAKEPADRPLDANQIRDELKTIAEKYPEHDGASSDSEAERASLTERLTTLPPSEDRSVSWKVLVGIVVAIVLLIGAALATSSR
jgi:serine/threonine protein kinase